MSTLSATVQGETLAVPHSLGTRPPATPAPLGAVDCHHHIFDPRFQKYGEIHVPSATVPEYQLFKRRLGLSRSIVVAPSNYGTDNACLMDALDQLGQEAARGVAYTATDVSVETLESLHSRGVRGIRVYLDKNQIPTREGVRELGRKVADLGGSLQFVGSSRAEVLVEWEDTLLNLPCPSVIDHFGWAPQPAGVHSKTARTLFKLLESGKVYVKLSGLYLSSASGFPDYSDLDELAAGLIEAAPERILWGTDWPHPQSAIRGQVPDGAVLFDRLAIWAPSAELRRRILVDNPDRLYWSD
ncbi:amidohydrolase family protein [Alloalcanivorax marinus]|uniref:amidohydrolase family protein n=1 Tax=Alloalcanivorax marinus TaxID=1177169 RepID=UPI001931EA6D|nr:amidohydrolase family protein [Alloalcanivorax marinus]MBL7250406.1 amidohydrolase family protein [Alloalcanivorax marinus]